ncbi:hypothetical protein [Bifidobacterium myosotis]|uniref:Uncharacterized protein n=1 Tax=Bifidobacterium myosotis TaxID=1630166 RepID=A0A5M9ZFP4_9BIFI|nr:hypothetical protein [Bifidobacterium myosotis]KAA8825103.1 hypothetical protein EMO91_12810 [Bifidobacterium myosotis]
MPTHTAYHAVAVADVAFGAPRWLRGDDGARLAILFAAHRRLTAVRHATGTRTARNSDANRPADRARFWTAVIDGQNQ